MKIAMTHEQADFDAIASLFAASQHFNSLPILPQNINRNVRSFLILYGSELPFIELKDLAQEEISQVYIVDTQSMLTLKGINRRTKVSIFDHHPIREDEVIIKDTKRRRHTLESDIKKLDLGATTTYFVELLENESAVVTPLQATLLLLGIYEDTGMLTYGQTQPRDARAAAWLLEQGAYLNMLPDFLNPPLTQPQREIYDQLMANHKPEWVHGFNIIYSFASHQHKVEEISTLAHKLRDFFDPDAIFIAVKTPEGIRVIGRSQTDEINISEFMRAFGGGGHIRAGSALTHSYGNDPAWQQSIYTELRGKLDTSIKPSMTVSKLMSRKPLLLDANMDIHEAEALMIKYGYEGFPVVKEDKLLGLLTRRAVDRAKRHKLNLKVSSVMEQGGFTVTPQDPIQTVQRVMTESGWGQVPVRDPRTNKIIGIVTRTDLIKTLGGKNRAIKNIKRIEEKIACNLSPLALDLIKAIAEIGADVGTPVYLVGGFVRDLLLGEKSTDFDIVVEGDAIALGEKLVEAYAGELKTHKRFGTGRWYLAETKYIGEGMPEFLDLISARQEFYEKPTALPSVENGNIKHDLHRRDFTINTLAIRLDREHYGELHDYYGGESDLNKKLIRVLHSLSFIDDPTRMIRAARYEGRYGFFVENRTRELVEEALPLLSHLSQERIRHEFDLVMEESARVSILRRCLDWGVLAALLPNVTISLDDIDRIKLADDPCMLDLWTPDLFLGAHTMVTLRYCLWFCFYTEEALDEIQTVFGYSAKVMNAIRSTAFIIHWFQTTTDRSRSDYYNALIEQPLMALCAAYLVTRDAAITRHVIDRDQVKLIISGRDLAERGIKPGPIFQEILDEILRRVLDEDLDPDGQKRALDEILKAKNLE